MAGTYVAVELSINSKAILREYLVRNLIPFDESSIEEAHITLAYSKKRIDVDKPDYDQLSIIVETIELWKTPDGDVLVMLVNAPQLVERHNHLRELGATYDYREYKPHITIGYDIGSRWNARSAPLSIVPMRLVHKGTEIVEDIEE